MTTSSLPVPPPVARWLAAVMCFVYGFAKLNGSQFTVLDSELARPLGDVSGFWLTWYYFGFSPVYGTLLAVVQIAAGALLVVPRTSLAGAILLLPMVGNIVLIDVFYGVDLGGTVAAVVLLLCVGIIVRPHWRRLLGAVLLDALPSRPSRFAAFALVGVMCGAHAFTWWVANVNNRSPTEIDGAWTVTAQTGTSRWTRVFFEYNRAHMAVFRGEGRPDEVHHFEIDSGGIVRVWQTWLTKGPLLMQGARQSRTRIDLDVSPELGGGRVTLERARATPAR